MRTLTFVCLLTVALALPASAAPASGLRKAWQDPAAVRSTFFIEGMTCRACTMMLHLHVNKKPGVFWARFNYPLRLLTVYHDPGKVTVEAVTALVDQAKEIRALHLKTQPAAGFSPRASAPLATWKNGSAPASEAKSLLKPFEGSLREQLGESEETVQVRYEILGEAVRNRILLDLARKAGYPAKGVEPRLPEVIAKDFYWPEKLQPPTRDEAGVARFLREKVLSPAKDAEERKRFDAWLLDLWKSLGFEFRGELAEGQAG